MERIDQVFQWLIVKQAQYDEVAEDIGPQPTDEEIEEFTESLEEIEDIEPSVEEAEGTEPEETEG